MRRYENEKSIIYCAFDAIDKIHMQIYFPRVSGFKVAFMLYNVDVYYKYFPLDLPIITLLVLLMLTI